jgi:hypothetical protein
MNGAALSPHDPDLSAEVRARCVAPGERALSPPCRSLLRLHSPRRGAAPISTRHPIASLPRLLPPRGTAMQEMALRRAAQALGTDCGITLMQETV